MCCYSTKQKTLLLQQQHSGVELSELRVNATFCKLGGCSFVEPAVGQQVGGFLRSKRHRKLMAHHIHVFMTAATGQLCRSVTTSIGVDPFATRG